LTPHMPKTDEYICSSDLKRGWRVAIMEMKRHLLCSFSKAEWANCSFFMSDSVRCFTSYNMLNEVWETLGTVAWNCQSLSHPRFLPVASSSNLYVTISDGVASTVRGVETKGLEQ
jgi:hypothetical protein